MLTWGQIALSENLGSAESANNNPEKGQGTPSGHQPSSTDPKLSLGNFDRTRTLLRAMPLSLDTCAYCVSAEQDP